MSLADEIKKVALGGIVNSLKTNVFAPIRNFFSVGKGGGVFAGILATFDDAKIAIQRTFKPITSA